MGQLLARYDDEAGGGPDSPIPVSAVVAHLLFLTCNDGAQAAVALADTFGTQAFMAVALAADVPQEFLDDVRHRFPDQAQPEPGEPWMLQGACQLPTDRFVAIAFPSMASASISWWQLQWQELCLISMLGTILPGEQWVKLEKQVSL